MSGADAADFDTLALENRALRHRIAELEAAVAQASPMEAGRGRLATEDLARSKLHCDVTRDFVRLITRAPDQQTLFDESCRIAVERMGLRMAWIGQLDDRNRTLKPAAWRGVEDGYLRPVETLRDPDGHDDGGPAGAAVREGSCYCCDDIAQDPRAARWRAPALQRGYRSALAAPIRVHDSVVGAFTLYACEPNAFPASDARLLEELTTYISFALEAKLGGQGRWPARAEGEQGAFLLNDVLNALPVGVWITDATGLIVMGNAAGKAIWAGERYVGVERYGEYKAWWSATGKRVEPHEWAAARAVSRGETSIDEELDIECFDGTRKSILNSAVPLLDADRAIIGAVVVNQDVTRRKEAETALLQRDSELREAQRIGGVGNWVFQLSGELTWSDETYRVFGVPPESFVPDAESFIKLIHPEDRAAMKTWIEACAAGRSPGELEFRRILDDGTVRYITGRGELLRNSAGEPLRMVGTAQDITERKLAEAERERLMAAIEQAGEIIYVTTPDGTIQYVNPAFERVTGYCRQEAIGQNPRILKSGKQDDDFYRELWQTLSSGNVWRGQTVNRRKDGRLYTEEATISPVCDVANRIVSYVAVTRDITEHLRLEAQLHASLKMDAIGRLAGGVAHDFNNALSVILSYTDLAARGLRPEDPLRGDLEEIKSAAERAAALTAQLLAFSRKQVLEPRILNLNQVIADLDMLLRRLTGESITCEYVLAKDLGRVRADPAQLEQVIMNLVVNARDAMPNGGLLRIETANVVLDDTTPNGSAEAARDRVVLSIADTGCGMDQAALQRLFEPFFTTKSKGSGLGLSAAYGIVKQSGGDIEVRSEPSAGTTVKILLPRLADETDAIVGRAPAPRPSVGSETILLVEDEEAVRNVTARILRIAGYTVLTAANGGEALLTCEHFQGDIHLILTDVVMPLMTGRELAERLQGVRPGLPALYMSGYTDDSMIHDGVLAHDAAFIAKPFNAASLMRKVRDVLDAAKSRR